jgi:hypothetical protein
MRPRRPLLDRRRLVPLALASLVLLAALASVALAQQAAPPDSGLGRYLGELSDSTDTYFGSSAAPPDTAGLDSVLFDSHSKPRRALALGAQPAFAFDRVNGSTPGVTAWLGETQPPPRQTGWGRLSGTIARANGPRENLGGARYTNRLWIARQPFDLDLWGGRRTSDMDRDGDERVLPLLRALVWGSDWTQYYRTDGFAASLELPRAWWRASLGYEDVLQRPLAVTATWNLLGRDLEMPDNVQAARFRVHELSGGLFAHWPRTPLRTEATLARGDAFTDRRDDPFARSGYAATYTRVRASAGADLTLGRFASLVPQVAYGRLIGDDVEYGALPQREFYLGGDGTLRSLERERLAGTGMAIGKLTLVVAQPVLPVAMAPMVPELFVASGAAWRHPVGIVEHAGAGDSYPTDGHPGTPLAREWHSEVGVGLVLRSPLFPQHGGLHVDYAWPIGNHAGPGRLSVSFTRAFDLMGPEPEPLE